MNGLLLQKHSLAVQRLEPRAFTAKGPGSMSDWGTNHTASCSVAK